jgi:hypothetical protein
LEAGLLERCGDCVKHVDGEGAGQFGAGKFDAGQIAVMAHAQFAETELAQAFFAALNLLRTSRVTVRPYSTREDRQGAAGRSQSG